MVTMMKTKKLMVVVVAGVLLLALFNLLVFPTTSSSQDRGLKLVHKGHHHLTTSSNSSVEVVSVQQAPPTTPSQQTVLAEHVMRTCKKQGLETHVGSKFNPDIYDHILVDDRYKMLYCNIPKVACTNWRRVMLILSGKVKAKNVLDIPGMDVHGRYKRLIPRLSDFSKAEIQYRLDNYFKFMFVREPFERLLSAWRNKFQSNTNSYFRKQFGVNILRRFRDSSEVKTEGKNGKPDKAVVKFEEFLQYIVDPVRTEALNEHWAKYHRLCLPCSVQYDFVGKYENLDQDAGHVLQTVHADHVVRFPKRSASYKHDRTSSYLMDYYKNISMPLLRRVYRLYKTDFELFDYSLPLELQGMFRGDSKDHGDR